MATIATPSGSSVDRKAGSVVALSQPWRSKPWRSPPIRSPRHDHHSLKTARSEAMESNPPTEVPTSPMPALKGRIGHQTAAAPACDPRALVGISHQRSLHGARRLGSPRAVVRPVGEEQTVQSVLRPLKQLRAVWVVDVYAHLNVVVVSKPAADPVFRHRAIALERSRRSIRHLQRKTPDTRIAGPR